MKDIQDRSDRKCYSLEEICKMLGPQWERPNQMASAVECSSSSLPATDYAVERHAMDGLGLAGERHAFTRHSPTDPAVSV